MKYKCDKYKSLTFFVDGAERSFKNGLYETDIKKEQDAIKKLRDVSVIAGKKLTPKEKLQAEAKELGVEFTEEMTANDLKELIKEAKDEDK